MNFTDSANKLRGRLSLIAYDIRGRELWRDSGNNLIVDSGYRAMADSLIGVAGAAFSHIEIGTSGAAPAASDSAITNPVKIEFTNVEQPSAGGIRLHFSIAVDMAVGMTIREFGIITKDGRLFSRKTRETLEKSEYMSIVGVWDINF